MNSFPPAPIFGVAGGGGGGDGSGNGGSLGGKFINIDDIFRECFMEADTNDLLDLDRPGAGESLAGGLGGDGGSVSANSGAGGIGNGASGSISVGAFHEAGGATPAMIPTQTQQQFDASQLNGISMFMTEGKIEGGTVPVGTGTSQAVLAGQQGIGVGIGADLGGGGALATAGSLELPPVTAAAAGAASRGGRGGAPGGRGYGSGSGRGGRGRGRGGGAGSLCMKSAASTSGLDEEDDEERVGKRGVGGKRPRQGGRNMTEQQRLDRRERNREHAKRSRVRKKFLLESLQKSVTALQEENEKLRGAIRANLGADEAKDLLSQTETSSLISSSPGDATKVLDDPDYSLVKALQTAQQNFVITDPTLPDNPIVFASQGFLELTGYTLDQVLGRNCRFLQGPDTDPKAVEKIRKAIENGTDASVCLRNYRVDGAMFWNQFFIAALRDSEGTVINYVGVQCRVDEDFVRAMQKREGEEEEDEEEEDDDEDDRSDTEHKDAPRG